ncbi:STAS domain-containing protein [Actinoplanes sp. GCM10030250]|uniref:STAS domain-containing protein n=1 Tax=Actinoplanes sp. GCM10030250 TaxID=3273376 RepID=UPI00361FC425
MSSRNPLDRADLLVQAPPPTSPDSIVIALSGDIDRENCSEMVLAVTDTLHRHPGRDVSLDMSEVTFLDSSGIRALLICRRTAMELGTQLKISKAHRHVQQVLSITNLLGVFHLPPDL